MASKHRRAYLTKFKINAMWENNREPLRNVDRKVLIRGDVSGILSEKVTAEPSL